MSPCMACTKPMASERTSRVRLAFDFCQTCHGVERVKGPYTDQVSRHLKCGPPRGPSHSKSNLSFTPSLFFFSLHPKTLALDFWTAEGHSVPLQRAANQTTLLLYFWTPPSFLRKQSSHAEIRSELPAQGACVRSLYANQPLGNCGRDSLTQQKLIKKQTHFILFNDHL